MRLPETNCPNCNSRQPFAPKNREVDGYIETYTRCLMCKHEIQLKKVPKRFVLTRRRARKERLKVR